ncbi:MAG: hypothetical protein LLF75_06730 [Eubacteriales bacterium]|nr:hypothetical protein [Eubacteriales bacterium]
MLTNGASSSTAIDWSDPEQASLQAKIDVMRNMITRNPMSYSEKDELVRMHLAEQAKRAEADQAAARKSSRNGWDI